MKMIKTIFLLLILASCSNQAKFQTGDCIQKPDEVHKWKVLEKRENESLIEKHTDLGEKNQKRILNSNDWVITNC